MKSANFAGRGGRIDAEIPNTETNIEKTSLRRARVLLLASAVFALGAGDALAAHHKPAAAHGKKSGEKAESEHGKHDKKSAEKSGGGDHKHVIVQPADEEGAAPLSPTLAAVKEAAELLRHGKGKDAAARVAATGDPVAMKLIEWAWLRHADSEAGFERYASFIRNNPDWPVSLIRRRAEGRLWQERRDGSTIHAFTGDKPASPPAGSRSPVCRSRRATAPRPRARCARYGNPSH